MDLANDQIVNRPLGEGSRVDDIMPLQTDSLSNSEKALKGYPIQIVEIRDEDHSFTLHEEDLKRIINGDKIKDLPVCVVSVAG